MTKSLDQILFQFYAQNDGLRITDLHQGIVWGTHTEQTRRHVQLINRFDYDGDYGTVLNRFLIQAAIGYPLTVHGTGGQTRAFIHIQDSVRCIELALQDAPKRGERVKIFNQMTETHRVRDLAELVAEHDRRRRSPGCPTRARRPPRTTSSSATTSSSPSASTRSRCATGLLDEVVEVAKKYAYRVDRSRIACGLGLDQGDRPDRRARPRAPRAEVAPDKSPADALDSRHEPARRHRSAGPPPTRTSSTPPSTWSPS